MCTTLTQTRNIQKRCWASFREEERQTLTDLSFPSSTAELWSVWKVAMKERRWWDLIVKWAEREKFPSIFDSLSCENSFYVNRIVSASKSIRHWEWMNGENGKKRAKLNICYHRNGHLYASNGQLLTSTMIKKFHPKALNHLFFFLSCNLCYGNIIRSIVGQSFFDNFRIQVVKLFPAVCLASWQQTKEMRRRITGQARLSIAQRARKQQTRCDDDMMGKGNEGGKAKKKTWKFRLSFRYSFMSFGNEIKRQLMRFVFWKFLFHSWESKLLILFDGSGRG